MAVRAPIIAASHCKNVLFFQSIRFQYPYINHNQTYSIMNTTILLVCILVVTFCSPEDNLMAKIQSLRDSRQLRGVQVQVSIDSTVAFTANLGEKNQKGQLVDSNTMFRIASLSKSFSSVALLQLVERGKLRLNQSLTSIFGYPIVNPSFPSEEITLQMVLSHQSSLIECEPFYSNFLSASASAKSGYEVPDIKEILVKGGKFYDGCLYSKDRHPGRYFDYVNLNFVIAGTIVQLISGQRFDQYLRDNILTHISVNLPETATFDISTIKDTSNLGVIYRGVNGKWTPTCDNYPDGKINPKNLTGYRIGSNAGVFGPQGSMRASASHLTNYALMLANAGVTKQGVRILKAESVSEIVKPRYHYHGKCSGAEIDFHQYGFGLYTTSYRASDVVISHQVVRGHIGDAYGLLSALYFWKQYTLTFIISGALNGYKYDEQTIYQQERMALHKAVEEYIQEKKQASLSTS